MFAIRLLSCCLGLVLVARPDIAAGQEQAMLAHDRDYSVNAERDALIACKPGDIQPFQGQTMSAVFGAAWPQQPQPTDASAHVSAAVVSMARLLPPRGLESQSGVVIMAALVDASGKMLAVEPVCLTSESYAIAARRALRTARFSPAMVNGQPITSVVAPALMFRAGRFSGDKSSSKTSGD